MEKESIIGRKFGKWTVIGFSHKEPKITFDKKTNKKRITGYRYYYICSCDCGTQRIVNVENLTRGLSKSCGCLLKEIGKDNIKNALKRRWKNHTIRKGTRLYRIWCHMKNRCYDKESPAYKLYGNRGIIVCNEWKNSFVKFKKWALDNGYNDSLTIDRIDVNGNYFPENCRWATRKQQSRNTRRNVFLEYNGGKRCLSEIAEETGIKYHTLLRRYNVGDRDSKLIRNVGGFIDDKFGALYQLDNKRILKIEEVNEQKSY